MRVGARWAALLIPLVALLGGCLSPSQAPTLTVEVVGDGIVTSAPAGIDTDAGRASATFLYGTRVVLEAEGLEGSAFAGFLGVTCEAGSSATTCVVTLTADAVVVATFTTDPVDVLEIAALDAVAGVQLTLAMPPYAGSITVEALRGDTTVRTALSGDRLGLAWVGASAVVGAQVRVRFVPPLASPPRVVDGVVLAEAGGGDLGTGALRMSFAASASTLESPLEVVALAVGSLTLDPAWADGPLGDVDGNGRLDVGDALRLVALTKLGSATDAEAYHADLILDDVVDEADLELLLERLVDPSMPPRLHVRPVEVPFVALDRDGGGEAWVLVGNAGRAPFPQLSALPPAGVEATAVGGVLGQSLALWLDLPRTARRGWRPGWLNIAAGPELATVRLGHLVVLVAGQSNATGVGSPLLGWPEEASSSVRVLGNDYVWRRLLEPMDDPTGQLDLPSRDSNVLYSMGTRLGFSLWEATGFEAYLIPSTRNGSRISWWLPGADRFDRVSEFSGGLFGSTNFRAHVSAGLRTNPVGGQSFGSEGGPVTALVWYQGESDADSRTSFQFRTNSVMNAFVEELGIPVIYVQLASDWFEQTNVRHHAVAELQRRMESTWGASGQRRQNYHMVVAFDLPRSDSIHLSAFGQRVLAERVALAFREHVLGEDIDGTGPRLNRDLVAWSGNQVQVLTTHVLAAGALDARYFTVFEGPPNGTLDDVADYGTNVIPIVEAVRDPADPSVVLLRLEREPAVTPYVRYMALPNVGPSTSFASQPGSWEVLAPGVVTAAEGSLPLPVFGPLPAIARP